MDLPISRTPRNREQNTSRRNLLAGTAAGLAAFGGSMATGLGASPSAEAATVGTDWIVLSPSGDTTGATDTTNINNNLKSCAPGQVVYLSNGVYHTNAPILIPQAVGLRGPIGATQSGDASGSLWGAILVPVSSWSPASGTTTLPVSAVITLIDIASLGAANTPASRMDIRDLWINGTSGPAGVDGIASWGAMRAVNIERVGIYRVSQRGIALYDNSNFTTGNFPDGWLLDTALAQSTGSDGFYGHFVDTTLNNCHAQSCGGDGFYIKGGNNRLANCRGDLATGYGFTFDAAGGGGYHDANTLVGCGTQRNAKSGLRAYNSSTSGQAERDPVIAVGCSFDGDGTSGAYAGLLASGETRLIAVNCNVLVMTVDVASGCPQYAIATAQSGQGVPDLVQVSGSFLNAVGALVHDAAPAANLRVDPSNSAYIGGPFTGTGTPVSPVQQPDYLGAAQENFLHQAGTVAATIPRSRANTAQGTQQSGTLYVTAIGIQAGVTVSKCTMFTNATAASGLSHGWYALLDRNLKVLAVTPDQTSGTWTAANTGYSLAFTHAYTTAYSGVLYVGVMVRATTPPTFSGSFSLATGVSGLAGLSGATPVYCGSSNSGMSTPPAVGTQMNPISSDGRYVFYAALS